MRTSIVGIEDEYSQDDRVCWDPVTATAVATSGFPPGLGYSRDFKQLIQAQRPDLIYCVGLWKYQSQACLAWHRSTGRPYMVAPHGMLDPWAMANHRLRKQVLWWLYQKRHLQSASCLRALNEAEATAIRNLGFKNPICIIPNGVDLPASEDVSLDSPDDIARTLLFLGRIHPKKGLELLLEAWSRVKQLPEAKRWELKIAGWGNDNDVTRLQRQLRELPPHLNAKFVGPLFNEEKADAFRSASAFILPSFSEGMPMTILEAWSYQLPVIMTPQCNIPAGVEAKACLLCQPQSHSIFEQLQALFEMPAEQSREMGQRGRKLVESNFTWEHVGQQLARVYQWLLGTAEPPDTVNFY